MTYADGKAQVSSSHTSVKGRVTFVLPIPATAALGAGHWRVHCGADPLGAAQGPAHDSRLIPGGSLDNAKTAIGMNAVDRDDLPFYANSTDQVDSNETPE